jgi:hypothetical protein
MSSLSEFEAQTRKAIEQTRSRLTNARHLPGFYSTSPEKFRREIETIFMRAGISLRSDSLFISELQFGVSCALRRTACVTTIKPSIQPEERMLPGDFNGRRIAQPATFGVRE